jgi:hypothetical protein
VSLFSGKRKGRSRGGVTDLTPPAGQAMRNGPTATSDEWAYMPAHGEPHIDPLLPDEWSDDEWSDDAWSGEWADDWTPAADGDDQDEPDDPDDPAEQEQSWDDDIIDQDDDVALRRRKAPAANSYEKMTRPGDPDVADVDDVDDDVPEIALPSSFRPVRNVPANQARGSHGAGRFPSADVVDQALRSATRPYRLDPFMFDPSSILVERLRWYVDAVDVGAAAGFEALVFDVSDRPGFGVQLVVPSALDGWNFDSAVGELEDMQMRTSGDSDTAVGYDPDGHVLCVSSLQHVDVYAVRLIGAAQPAVAVEIADRYAQVIDDDL